MRFRIFNHSKNEMDLRLDFKDQDENNIKIISIEEGADMGKVSPGQSRDFVLRLFAVKCGVTSLSGLLISDLESRKDIMF